MKKGFTLIELLAVIIILAIVALIATPIVLDVVDDARTSASKSETALIVSGINNYCATAEMKAQLNNTTSDCAEGVTKEDVSKMVDLGNAKVLELTYDKKVTYLKVESNRKIVEYDGSIYKIDGEVVETPNPEEPTPVLYKDNSGANTPKLLDNMIPVKYENNNWIYADVKEKWYDYDAKEWANAIVLNSGVTKAVGDTIRESEIALMYVWIPRYTYTIFNGNNGSVQPLVIDVKFESGTNSSGTVTCTDAINQTDANGNLISEICTDEANGSVVNGRSTYTHPAFTFGTQTLTGFWAGKFEVSGSTDKITIKPSVSPLVSLTPSQFFTAIQDMKTYYGLNGDSHMMKNMEWGAVSYLQQSKYGKADGIGINNSFQEEDGIPILKTGCGTAVGSASEDCNTYNAGGEIASTTGNVYGVYDMSGGAYEYVMGSRVNSNGTSVGFTATLDSKYYDLYTYDASNNIVHDRGKLGDATKETIVTLGNVSGGWGGDTSRFPIANLAWFLRGGCYSVGAFAGVYSFERHNGNGGNIYSTRAVLVK